ncbi:MAG: asparagine synthase C-terminal domain-containing protein [Acidobacteriia bacterium]|nr:asparagine synthase C-terminal domain-containing protein [Terriglobia bacterium]
MSGICGWVGGALRREAACERRAIMAGHLARGEAPQVLAHVGEGAAIAVVGTACAISLHVENAIIAVVEGYPIFKDDEFAALAARDGAAAALARAFARVGRELPKIVAGECAYAIIDTAARRALVAIDRLATRAMCHAEPAPGMFIFGTTVDAVAAYSEAATEIDPQALFDYLYFTRVPAPATIWRGIRKLLPAESIWCADSRCEVARYWSVPYGSASNDVPFDSRVAEVKRLLRQSTDRALAGEDNAQVGAFLSGGVDSSTVVGFLAERRGARTSAFSIGFAAEGYDEIAYAAAAAQHFKVPHHVYNVTPEDVADTIPLIAESYDEPFGNSSAVPSYQCARFAREHGIDLLLAGDGGDEIFGGNSRYAEQKIFEAYGHLPHWLRSGVIEPVVGSVPGGDRLYPVRKARAYLRKARTPLPDRLEIDNPYATYDLRDVLDPAVASGVDPGHPIAIMKEAYERCRAPDAVYRMMALDQQITLADDDLRKVGRMCETAGIRVRFPLFDDALGGFSAGVPAGLLVTRFTLRFFFKKAMSDILPPSTLRKSKHGFGLPIGPWLGTCRALNDAVTDHLAVLARGHLVRPDFIEKMRRAQAVEHAGFYGQVVWVLVMLGAWSAKIQSRRGNAAVHHPTAQAVRAALLGSRRTA